MTKINIIGLGPGRIGSLSLDAVEKIKDKHPNYLRTKHHPTVEYLDENQIDYISFDDYYHASENFEEVYRRIVDKLIEEAEKFKEINYFVPGNPMIAEKTVEILLKSKDIVDIELISGMSFIEPMLELLELDPIDGLKIIDGAQYRRGLIDINTNIIISQTYNIRILSDIKLSISEIYGDEYEIFLVNSAGIVGQEKIEKIAIYELDRVDQVDHLTSIFIPKVDDKDNKLFDFNDLVGIMELLRGDNGCPWDIKQTHNSLRRNLIEESYELVEAIEKDDIDNMIEELGDVLLQVLFHINIAEEEGTFNFYDVTSALGRKLVNRHPHIFSKNNLVKQEKVLYNWDTAKNHEKNLITMADKLDNITSSLPSLERAYKIQEEASKVGFDWPDIYGAIDKLEEEKIELLEAIKSNNLDHIEDELGDVLFTVVNISRFLELSPEIALNRANNKFINRFIKLEENASRDDLKLEDLTLEDLDKLWEMSKK